MNDMTMPKVAIGDVYAFFDGSPWPPKIRVRVLDVKDGWVRYSLVDASSDDRALITGFLSMYRKVEAP